MNELELYDHITLADGTIYQCDYLASIPLGFTFISLITDDVSNVFSDFTNSEKTNEITYGNNVLTGFTVFVSITQEAAGRWKVALRKPFTGE